MGTKIIQDYPEVDELQASDLFLLDDGAQYLNANAEDISKFTNRDSQYADKIDTVTSDYDYSDEELEPNNYIFIDVTGADRTLGFFNGSTRDGAMVCIKVIGSGSNKAYLEIYSEGVTDYELSVGDSIIFMWDDTNSIWQIIYCSIDTIKSIPISATMEMQPRRKYITSGQMNLTLPEIAEEGDEIEIITDDIVNILQNADNIISYLNKYFTTEGTDGYVKLKKDNNIRMVYKGTGYKFVEPGVKLSDPATKPTNIGEECAFSPDGVYLAVAHTTSPYITIYKRDGDTFTKLSNPGTLPTGVAYGCAFSPDGIYLAVAHSSDPYITIYKRSGDTFTKLSDPATKPTGIGRDCTFSPDGIYLAVAHATDPYITIYKRSGDTFTKLSDPATKPTGNSYGCAFSPDENYLAVVHATTPYITIYKRSGDTFTKLTDPGTLPTITAEKCVFSPDGIYLAVAHMTDPYITIYKRSGDTFTKLADPATKPTGDAYGCTFSSNGNYLAVAHVADPYITVYKRSGDTFIKLADPITKPAGIAYGCAFSPDDVYLAVTHTTDPYVTIYKNTSEVDEQWQIKELNTLYQLDLDYMFF